MTIPPHLFRQGISSCLLMTPTWIWNGGWGHTSGTWQVWKNWECDSMSLWPRYCHALQYSLSDLSSPRQTGFPQPWFKSSKTCTSLQLARNNCIIKHVMLHYICIMFNVVLYNYFMNYVGAYLQGLCYHEVYHGIPMKLPSYALPNTHEISWLNNPWHFMAVFMCSHKFMGKFMNFIGQVPMKHKVLMDSIFSCDMKIPWNGNETIHDGCFTAISWDFHETTLVVPIVTFIRMGFKPTNEGFLLSWFWVNFTTRKTSL